MEGKPERRTREGPKTPEVAKPPFSKRHPRLAKAAKAIGTGAASLAVAAGLACAPAARGQTLATPSRPTTTIVQSPARVSSSEVPARPAGPSAAPTRHPETNVAEATRPGTSSYQQTETGAPSVSFTIRRIVSGLLPLVDSTAQYVRSEINPPRSWDVELDAGPLATDPSVLVTVYATLHGERTEIAWDLFDRRTFQMLELPTPETRLVGKGILILLDHDAFAIIYYNKTTNSYDYTGARFGVNFPQEKLVVAANILASDKIVNLIALPPSSLIRDGNNRIIGIVEGSLIYLSSIMFNETSRHRPPITISRTAFIIEE